MFIIGEYVVYGGEGVCKVDNIGTIDMDGRESEKQYYTLKPVYAGGSVYTPVSSDKVVIRRIISKEETQKLIEDIPNMKALNVANERGREQVYKDALKTCDCRELIRLIKTVYDRREKRMMGGKRITAVDEKYFRTAKEQLYGELAIPLNMEKDKVADYIENCIEHTKEQKQTNS